jgi:predicted transcriptional regulator
MGVDMRTLKMKQLDEKDEEIADILMSLGMSRNAALTPGLYAKYEFSHHNRT